MLYRPGRVCITVAESGSHCGKDIKKSSTDLKTSLNSNAHGDV